MIERSSWKTVAHEAHAAPRARSVAVQQRHSTTVNLESPTMNRSANIEGPAAANVQRGYADLHEHLEQLRARGLLLTIDRPIDKDSELHPLVRWQFVGGLHEDDRKAFLFTNIIDGR